MQQHAQVVGVNPHLSAHLVFIASLDEDPSQQTLILWGKILKRTLHFGLMLRKQRLFVDLCSPAKIGQYSQ